MFRIILSVGETAKTLYICIALIYTTKTFGKHLNSSGEPQLFGQTRIKSFSAPKKTQLRYENIRVVQYKLIAGYTSNWMETDIAQTNAGPMSVKQQKTTRQTAPETVLQHYHLNARLQPYTIWREWHVNKSRTENFRNIQFGRNRCLMLCLPN